MKLGQILPIAEWLPSYSKKDFKGDLIAGLTVAIMLIPQGMAYALLAGLPPIYGLYAGIVPLLLYAFFGSSRQLSVGPVALVSLLILSGVSQFAEPKTELFITLAITTALIAGIIQVILGAFRLGFLINFLSHPVIAGFTSAAAFIIGFSQLRNLLGIDISRSNKIHVLVSDAFLHLQEVNFVTLGIAVGSIVLMLILKKIRKNMPYALIAVIVGTIVVWGFSLDSMGVSTVGDVPKGLPGFVFPQLTFQQILDLMPLALTICLISFIESLAIAKTIESRHKNYRVRPNQELIALGLAKIGGSFFQAFPTTGSFTRSAINDEAGAKTGISSIISASIIALILLFLTPLFFYLPKAILAAIIVVAVIGLVDIEGAVKLWKTDKRDFASLITTFIITLIVGIQVGVFAGVILSIGIIIFQNSRPHIAILGRMPDTAKYRNITRFPQVIQWEDIVIMRFDAQLYFANTEYFRETVETLTTRKNGKLKLIILDCSSMHDVDSSGVQVLKEVIEFLDERGIRLYFSGVIGPVRDMFAKTELMETIGFRNQFLRIHDAVNFYQDSKNGIE
jgi:SulP family sulfate permease